METDGRRHSWKSTKILPLFHGTNQAACHSICESGHTFFGKTNLSINPEDSSNTDDGYFGSGIYFTDSAKYAADIYSEGHLVMSWVSMRQPFPIVGNSSQDDMKFLRGKGAHKDYNAHYIPVTSLDPSDPDCPEYYVDAVFLKTITFRPQYVEDLIPHLITILQNADVDSDKKLRNYLNQQLDYLLKQPSDDYLDDHDLSTLHEKLQTLVDASGQVNKAAVKTITLESIKSKILLPSQAKASIPSIAFGASQWEHYFEIKVEEPPLPPDIEDILKSACPFFPGKQVEQTHFLTLVPAGINTDKLEKLTGHPKKGNRIGFFGRHCSTHYSEKFNYLDKTISKQTHWVLMPHEVVPESRNKSWEEQKTLATNYQSQGYELLSILDGACCLLLDYVQKKTIYNPWTWIRCVTDLSKDHSPEVIGDFTSDSLKVYPEDGVKIGIAYPSYGIGLARKFF